MGCHLARSDWLHTDVSLSDDLQDYLSLAVGTS